MKRITALITVITIILTMAVPVLAADSYVAVSMGKPISALVDPDEGNPEYANDDSSISRYTGNKNNSPNALTIDLERKYILDHVVTYASNVDTSSIYVSNDSEFTTYTELEFYTNERNRYYYKIPSAYASVAYRYVRFNFTPTSNDVLVRDFQAYTTAENSSGDGPQQQVSPLFEEELIKISEDKPILSKQYGTGAGWGTDVVANAVDNSPDSQFISCQVREKVDWVTIDLEEAEVINKIVSVFTAQRTYGVYVTNTAYGQEEEFTDGIKLNETSEGSKVFVLPDENKKTAYRYVRLYFEGDAPNNGSDTEQNIYIKDISIYKSTRDVVYDAVEEKFGALTDGDTEISAVVANNTVIDLLTPTYISSYELFGADKDNVTIKGSLFNEAVDNMTEIPKETTENNKYRYIAIVSNSGEAVSLNEIKIWSFFSDVVTPWTINDNTCSVAVTNTSHKDDRAYTFTVAALDEYDSIIDFQTVTETLECGMSKNVAFLVYGLELAKKVVCTIERDGILVSAPSIFVDGVMVPAPSGTPYTNAPDKDIESAVVRTDYNDGLELNVTGDANSGIVDSDILTFSVYNSAGELLAKDVAFGDGTFKYRLPGDADAGEYEAVLLVTDAVGNSVVMKYPFTKTASAETDITSAINAFVNAATDEDFQAAYQTHYVTNGAISFSDIPEAEAFLTNGIGDSFINMMSARSLWKKDPGEALTAEDIRACMKAAVVENSLENGRANAPTILTKYATVLDNVFDGKQNNTYTAELFKKGAANNEELIYNMKVAAALSQIKNASSENIVGVLQDYSSILSVDISSITASGVDIYLVAKRLDNAIPESYKDGLADEITQIVNANKIPEDNNDNNNTVERESNNGGYVVKTPNVMVDDDYEIPEQNEDVDGQYKEEGGFADVPDDFWATESIIKLASAGIISGRGDGNFDPNSNVSRAEFATMLVKAFKLISKPEEKPEFSDCNVGDWFYPFVDAAVTNNIVSGISETEFSPASPIKRQDACVMSYNIMIYKNYLKYFAGKTFTDSETISSYAVDAVNLLSGSGVISGFDDGSFGPHELLTRAQAAVIIHRFMVLLGEEV